MNKEHIKQPRRKTQQCERFRANKPAGHDSNKYVAVAGWSGVCLTFMCITVKFSNIYEEIPQTTYANFRQEGDKNKMFSRIQTLSDPVVVLLMISGMGCYGLLLFPMDQAD